MYQLDFPIFQQKIHGKPLVYLDHSATSQKPRAVIDAMSQFYETHYANIHRGVYALSEMATKAFEAARTAIQQWIHAKKAHEIIFTSGTTESINLVAQSFGRHFFKKNDEILLSAMEHHSNIVPWQRIAEETGALIKVIPISEQGEIDLEAYSNLLTPKTKMVAITHVSNVLGTINPIQKMIALAHANHTPVLIDGAQAFSHLEINVEALDCDFYAFSSHKAYGPTGVGVLYAKEQWLDVMPPYQSGGDMIERVSFEKTTYAQLPAKFEAGTPNIAGVIGFHHALQYMQSIGMSHILEHSQSLGRLATQALSILPGIQIYGHASDKVGIVSFTCDSIHPHDIATILDHEGVSVRAGHHCAMPLMTRLNIPACVRVSFGIYNSNNDVDALIQALVVTQRVFNQDV